MELMYYKLELQETAAATGYFSSVPDVVLSLDALFEYLHEKPYDEFMHHHMLRVVSTFREERMTAMIENSIKENNHVLTALLFEA